jgi:hypothetical protein
MIAHCGVKTEKKFQTEGSLPGGNPKAVFR